MKYKEKEYQRKITLGQSGNAVMSLLAICLVLYIIFAFTKAIWFYRFETEQAPVLFRQDVLGWVGLPAGFHQILNRPWTLITQMFVHDNVWKVFTNMLWLWSFGHILQDLTGNRKVIPIFIYGSLAGGIAFVLMYHLLPSLHSQIPFAMTYGASAGVMAIAIATTLVAPNYKLFPMIGGGIPLWVLTAVYVLIDLGTTGIHDPANLASHLAGAAFALLFMFALRRGYDWSEWMNNFFDWFGNLFNPDRPRKGALPVKEELFYKSTTKPFKKTPNLTQQRVDDILDKINQKGYHFLTDEEKEL
jgi:membrane associated rhomboid family serine protease